MTVELDAAILRAEALEVFGELNLVIGVATEAARERGRRFPVDGVVVTMVIPTHRGRPEPVFGHFGRVVRTLDSRGRQARAEVAFTFGQVSAMVERLAGELDDLAPPPEAAVARVRAYLEGLTPAELKKLHRETFPEEYAG